MACAALCGTICGHYVSACAAITFIDDGRSTGVCVLPATHASIMSAHSCSMCRRCSAY